VKKILIIGAGSAIAKATAREFAGRGDGLFLIGRDEAQLQRIAADLKVRGAAAIGYGVLDVNDFDRHADVLRTATEALGGLDVALIAHGTLSDQQACEKDFSLALRELNTNAISVISLLTHLASAMEDKRAGQLAIIGSVAGDRGRGSNYVYGTAKAAVEAFTEGLRCRMYRAGVQVLLVKPGFVDTPMTREFTKGLLWTRPETIARAIVRGLDRRTDVLYVPRYWHLIMQVVTSIPTWLFKRMQI
jgi:decaprenylphospho-beta-D-erythro-pentofuranosid-2-ulose 2-reductase